MKNKENTSNKEIRYATLRAAPLENEEKGERILEGYAATLEQPTVIYESREGIKYYEVIDKGAFDGADMSDVPFKYNHSDNLMIMARTRNDSLKLSVDNKGLKIEAKLADTTTGRDLYTLVEGEYINKMSFAFTVAEDSYNSETRTRRILKFKKIYDVSAVDWPAYDSTSISARSYFEEKAHEEINKLENKAHKKRVQKLKIRCLL